MVAHHKPPLVLFPHPPSPSHRICTWACTTRPALLPASPTSPATSPLQKAPTIPISCSADPPPLPPPKLVSDSAFQISHRKQGIGMHTPNRPLTMLRLCKLPRSMACRVGLQVVRRESMIVLVRLVSVSWLHPAGTSPTLPCQPGSRLPMRRRSRHPRWLNDAMSVVH